MLPKSSNLLLSTVLGLAAGTAVAQHPAPIPITDYSTSSEERNVVWAQISPDGDHVAYMTIEYDTPNLGDTRVRLRVRNSDGSSPFPTTVYSQVNAIFLSATWRWDGTKSDLLYIHSTPTQWKPLNAWNPTTGTSLVRNINDPGRFFLQQQPCGNRILGTRVTPLPGNANSQVWWADLTGSAAPNYLSGTNSVVNLAPVDMSPDGTAGVYRTVGSSPSSFRANLAAGGATPLPLPAGASQSTVAGWIDNQNFYTNAYGAGRAFLARGEQTFFDYDDITDGQFFEAYDASAVPEHLGGFGLKRSMVYVGEENGAFSVRMGSVQYGGDITLATPTAPFDRVYTPTADATGSRVAYIASDLATGGGNQIFVVPTNREIRATFTKNSVNSVYEINGPCGASEVCLLALAGGLVPGVFPWGPPGQVDLDPASSVIRVVATGAPAFDTFAIANDPAFLGIPFFFQVLRDEAGALNSTRAARVIYR